MRLARCLLSSLAVPRSLSFPAYTWDSIAESLASPYRHILLFAICYGIPGNVSIAKISSFFLSSFILYADKQLSTDVLALLSQVGRITHVAF